MHRKMLVHNARSRNMAHSMSSCIYVHLSSRIYVYIIIASESETFSISSKVIPMGTWYSVFSLSLISTIELQLTNTEGTVQLNLIIRIYN